MSTSGPKDGSETAKVINDVVEKCGHARAVPDELPVETVEDLAEAATKVASAEFCMEAALRLRDSGVHQELMEDYLNQSVDDSTAADALLRRAEDEQALAASARQAAQDAAASAGVSISLGLPDLIQRGTQRAGEAKILAFRHPGLDAANLRARCDAVLERAKEFEPS